MSERNWKFFLSDILMAISKIENYVQNVDLETFLQNEMIQDAVIRNLEIIGEATKQIPQNVKDKNQNIPWKQMAGLRDRLIHGYFVVDLNIVWHIVNKELPEVKAKLLKLLNSN